MISSEVGERPSKMSTRRRVCENKPVEALPTRKKSSDKLIEAETAETGTVRVDFFFLFYFLLIIFKFIYKVLLYIKMCSVKHVAFQMQGDDSFTKAIRGFRICCTRSGPWDFTSGIISAEASVPGQHFILLHETCLITPVFALHSSKCYLSQNDLDPF